MSQSITDPTVKDPDPTLNQPLLGASVPGGADDVGSQIDALYKKAGLSDAGAGGGFADRAYWLAHPSEVLNGRLGRDLEGTGTDQPTGTPGRGAWLNSGRDAPEASIGQPTRTANGGFWTNPIAAPTAVVPPAVPSGTTPSATTTTSGASSPTGQPSMSGPVPLKANGKVDTDAINATYPSMSAQQRQTLIAYLLAHPELQGDPGAASPSSPSGAGTIPDTMGGVPNP
jgi:hypothetical protein